MKEVQRDWHSRSCPLESCALLPPDILGINYARAGVFSNWGGTKGLFEIPAGTLAQVRCNNGPANRQPLLAACQGEWDTCQMRTGLGGFAIIMAPDPRVYLNPSSPLQAPYSISEFSLVSAFSSSACSSERLLEP